MTTWDLSRTNHHVLICNGGSCMRKGGEEVTQAIREELAQQGYDDFVHTTRTRCNGRCEDACVVIVYPDGVWYKDVTPNIGKEIVHKHIIKGKILVSHTIYTYNGQCFLLTNGLSVGINKTKKQKKATF